MRRISKPAFLLPAMLAIFAAGCTDRLPTLSGEGPFPVGGRATTIELTFDSGDFLLESSVHRGPTGIADASALLLARNFDGALNSHALATFGGFPDTVEVAGESYTDFLYEPSQVRAVIPDTLTASHTALELRLWTVTQPWDTAAVSWENAVDREGMTIPWSEPGGTRGELIATTMWLQADTGAVADSLIWDVPADLVRRLADDDLPGLMVTLGDLDARVNVANLMVRASIRPGADLDTTVVRTVPASSETFVFSPDAPAPEDVYRVGGITSDRTVLRLAVPTELPGCAPSAGCPDLRADAISLDRVELILDPLPVAHGFRPIGELRVFVREVLELELGERATLGSIVAADTVPAARFAESGAPPFSLVVTGAFQRAIDEEVAEIGLALLVEPEASRFGYGWFARNPRLRILYTLPVTPQLP
ncbi:MAG: hypothetical protein WD766_09940 [Gemmatimonadota bacterium]